MQANLSFEFVTTLVEVLDPCQASRYANDVTVSNGTCLLPTTTNLFLVRLTSADNMAVASMNYSRAIDGAFSAECPDAFVNSTHCLNSGSDPQVTYALINVTFRNSDVGNITLVVEACTDDEHCVSVLLQVELQRPINIRGFINDPIYAGEYISTVEADFVGNPYSIDWMVEFNETAGDFYNETMYFYNETEELHFAFFDPGRYVLTVTIWNDLHQRTYSQDVYAFDMFNATNVTMLRFPAFDVDVAAFGRNTRVTSSALFSPFNRGSFLYWFDDGTGWFCDEPIENTEDTATYVESDVRHRFQQLGEVLVNVTLNDPHSEEECGYAAEESASMYGFAVGLIQVWNPIHNVTVHVEPYPVETGQLVTISVRQYDGTGNITLEISDFDDGSDPEQVDGTSQVDFLHNYTEAGLFNLTVTASNIVTEESVTAHVWAQERITGFSLSDSATSTLIGSLTSIVVTLETGTDVTYTLTDDFGHRLTQRRSEFSLNYTRVGNYTVNVSAENGINEEWGSVDIRIEDLSPFEFYGITHEDCVATDVLETYEANISYHNENWLLFTWQFADGTVQQQVGLTSVEHTFAEAGQSWVSLEIESHYAGAVSPTEINSSVCVQQRISGLQFRDIGESLAVGFDRGHDVTYVFELVLETGTDVYATWSYFGETYTTDSLTETITFETISVETIYVTVWNNVSQSDISIDVYVYENVDDVTVHVNGSEAVEFDVFPSTFGVRLEFEAAEGSNITWQVSIMDSTTNETVQEQQLAAQYFDITAPEQGADWSITVSALNPASSSQTSFQLQFQEAISGLSVSTSVELVAQDETAQFEFSLDTGSHMMYSWVIASLDADNDETVVTSGETDDVILEWIPRETGEYVLHVNASNDFNLDAASFLFTVWQVIPIQITANVDTLPYVSVGDVITFDVTVDADSPHTFDSPTYTWHVDDVTWDVSQSGASSVEHGFEEVGDYEVSVDMVEGYKRASYNLTLRVQEPISGLHLALDSASSDFLVNENITLNLTTATGSHVELRWRLIDSESREQVDDFEVEALDTDRFLLRVGRAGTFRIRVTASNGVSQERATVRGLFVYEAVTGLSIDFCCRYSVVGNEVLLEASVETGNAVYFHIKVHSILLIFLSRFRDRTDVHLADR